MAILKTIGYFLLDWFFLKILTAIKRGYADYLTRKQERLKNKRAIEKLKNAKTEKEKEEAIEEIVRNTFG